MARSNSSVLEVEAILGIKGAEKFASAMEKAGDAGFGARRLGKYEKGLMRIQERLFKAQRKGDLWQMERQRKMYDEEITLIGKVSKRRLAAAEKYKGEMLDAGWDAGEKFGDAVSGVFADITSGQIGGIGEAIKKLGTATRNAGHSAEASESTGALGKMLPMLGKVLAGVGSVVMVVGALAAGIAALAKMFLDADAQAKELNKTLFDSGVSIGDIAGGMGDVEGSLENIRKAATDFSNNMKWGTLAADQVKILAAFNETGYTLREITNNTKDATVAMRAYQVATAAALKYANLLGDSTDNVAKQMAEHMEDLGLTLDGVQQRFEAIYSQAMLSGFGTKRFFGMVLQATSGMSMFNVRLEEAAGLLIRLGKILGAKVGDDFFKSLSKGFMDESMQDRYKRVMLTGPKLMAKIMRKSAQSSAEDFASKLGQAMQGNNVKGDLNKALAGAGFKGLTAGADLSAKGAPGAKARSEFGAKLVQQLKGMSPNEQGKAIAKLKLTLPHELVIQMENLLDVSKGTSGNIKDMAMGLGGLEPGAKLAAQLNRAMGIFGKPLHDLGFEQLTAFENATGISGESLDQLKRVSRSMTNNYAVLKDMRGENIEANSDRDKQLAEAYGATIRNGEVVSAAIDSQGQVQTGKVIGDSDDYVMSQGDALKAVMDSMSKSDATAEAIARNTTEMSKYLQMGVESFLEGIYSTILKIWAWLPGTKDNREARTGALDIARGKRRDLTTRRGVQGGELSGLQRSLDTEKDAVKRKALVKDIEAKKKELEQTDNALRAQQRITDAISKVKTGGSAKDVLAAAEKQVYGSKTWVQHTSGKKTAAQQTTSEAEISMGQDIARDVTRQTADLGQLVKLLEEKYGPEDAKKRMDKVYLGARDPEIGNDYRREMGALDAAKKDLSPEQYLKGKAGVRKKYLEQTGTEETPGTKAHEKAQLALFEYLSKEAGAQTALLEDQKTRGVTSSKEDREYRKRFFTDLYRTEVIPLSAAKNAEEMAKEFTKAERLKTAQGIAGAAGFKGAELKRVSGELAGGRMPAELAARLRTMKGPGWGNLAQELLQLSPANLGSYYGQIKEHAKVNDFILRGRNMFPISEADVVTGSKTGGPLSRRGGGGTTNVFHIYNDGPGMMNTLEKAMRAGILS